MEKAIKQNMFKHPEESLLVSLCFYHGLSTSNTKNIKVKDIDVDGKRINFKNRSPVHLLKDDLIMLEAYAKVRREIKNIINKPYLFVSTSSSEIYRKDPVSNKFIREKVKKFLISHLRCYELLVLI